MDLSEQPLTKCFCNGGVRCPHYFRFLYLNLSRGTGRNWSALTFRFAPLLRPPMPATAETQTLAAIFFMTREFQKEFDDIVKRTVAPFFKGLGFKKNGNGFNRTTNDIIQAVNIQKSQWNHADNVSFTFNIGFFSGDIYKDSWDKDIPKFIREYDCPLHFRLGHVTKQTDYWYELNEKVTADDLGNEIKDHLDNFLKPILETVQTMNSMKEFITRNKDIKLTTATTDQIVLLLKTGDRDKAEKLLRDEYKDSLTPKESVSVTTYPDGRREEKISKPTINKVYVDRLKRLASLNKIEL